MLELEILPLTKEVLVKSTELLTKYPNLNIFDSIHLAHAILEGSISRPPLPRGRGGRQVRSFERLDLRPIGRRHSCYENVRISQLSEVLPPATCLECPTGLAFENPKFIDRTLEKIKKVQKQLSKRRKGSKRRKPE